MKKRFLVLAGSIALMFALTACGKRDVLSEHVINFVPPLYEPVGQFHIEDHSEDIYYNGDVSFKENDQIDVDCFIRMEGGVTYKDEFTATCTPDQIDYMQVIYGAIERIDSNTEDVARIINTDYTIEDVDDDRKTMSLSLMYALVSLSMGETSSIDKYLLEAYDKAVLYYKY